MVSRLHGPHLNQEIHPLPLFPQALVREDWQGHRPPSPWTPQLTCLVLYWTTSHNVSVTRYSLTVKISNAQCHWDSINSSSERIYHARDNVLLRRPLIRGNALNKKLVLAVVVRGDLLGRLHRNYNNFSIAMRTIDQSYDKETQSIRAKQTHLWCRRIPWAARHRRQAAPRTSLGSSSWPCRFGEIYRENKKSIALAWLRCTRLHLSPKRNSSNLSPWKPPTDRSCWWAQDMLNCAS